MKRWIALIVFLLVAGCCSTGECCYKFVPERPQYEEPMTLYWRFWYGRYLGEVV